MECPKKHRAGREKINVNIRVLVESKNFYQPEIENFLVFWVIHGNLYKQGEVNINKIGVVALESNNGLKRMTLLC